MPPGGLTLPEVVEQLPGLGLWLICMPPDADRGRLQRLCTVREWTVLCGSDEAAVAGTNHLVRTLIERGREQNPPCAPHALNLMVMGCDLDKGKRVAREVNLAAANTIDRSIALLGCIRRMTPVNTRVVGSFEDDAGQWAQALAAMQRGGSSADGHDGKDEASDFHVNSGHELLKFFLRGGLKLTR